MPRGSLFLSIGISESDADGESRVPWRFPEIPFKVGGGETPSTNRLGNELRQEESLELRFEFIFFYLPTLTFSLCWFSLGW